MRWGGMPRKRKRRRLKPAPILVLLLIANVAAGIAYSPLTSITKVRVVGAEPFDRPRLQTALQTLTGRPCNQVQPRDVETEALQIPEALDSDFARNIFGHAELKMHYRTPVARLEAHPDQLLDISGQLYSSRQVVSVLPALRLPPENMFPLMSFMQCWPSKSIAEVCAHLPRQIPREGIVLEVMSRGELCLNIGQSGRIVFGSTGQIDEKLNKLEALLKENPRLLTETKELNLTAPSHPVSKPIAEATKP